MSARDSQRDEILALLLAAGGNWVPLPQIVACAAQYNARIFELRRDGYRILNHTREVDGQKHSWFRLETGLAVAAYPASADPGTPSAPPSFPEFGSLEPERYGV